jgi:hypothetical protein
MAEHRRDSTREWRPGYPSHAARIHAGVQHDNKELHVVKDATHYYIGRPDRMAEAVAIVAG